MERKIPDWCKEAKIAMIRKDITIPKLVEELGFTRQYISSIINGRVYAAPVIKKISDYLDISDNYELRAAWTAS